MTTALDVLAILAPFIGAAILLRIGNRLLHAAMSPEQRHVYEAEMIEFGHISGDW